MDIDRHQTAGRLVKGFLVMGRRIQSDLFCIFLGEPQDISRLSLTTEIVPMTASGESRLEKANKKSPFVQIMQLAIPNMISFLVMYDWGDIRVIWGRSGMELPGTGTLYSLSLSSLYRPLMIPICLAPLVSDRSSKTCSDSVLESVSCR